MYLVYVTCSPLVLSFECVRAGHCYYFLEDVYPRMTGRRPLKTPGVIRALFPEAGIGFMRTQPPAAQPAFPAPGVVPPPGAQH